MTRKKSKSRNFAFILYPESIPEDWEMKLQNIGVPMAVSPLHDKDEMSKKDLTDEQKKAVASGQKFMKKGHYHVLYVANNPVTTESIRNKIKRALGDQSLSNVQIVDNMEYYYDYLTHESKDAIAKGKHVYSKKDIKLINGFDIARFRTMSEDEKKELKDKLIGIVIEQNIPNAIELDEHVREYPVQKGAAEEEEYYELDDVRRVIGENASMFRIWFDGVYQKQKRAKSEFDEKRIKRLEKCIFGEMTKYVDSESGEILE